MGVAADYVSRTRIGAHFHSARESRKLILVIVAVALLLDNMLLTTVGKFFLKFFSFFGTILRETEITKRRHMFQFVLTMKLMDIRKFDVVTSS